MTTSARADFWGIAVMLPGGFAREASGKMPEAAARMPALPNTARL